MSHRKQKSPATYLVTWACNDTPVHKGFLAALRNFPGELVVIKGQYKNPTSKFDAFVEGQENWAPELAPYLLDKGLQLCPNLKVYGDIRVQPTAARPLSGFEVFCGSNSGVFGHPKRALEVVPTATRSPRILATTGSITLPNYSESKAGKKGQAHHVIGALVVEIEASGIYHLRHVSAEASGAFIDLDKRYTPDGVEDAPEAMTLTLGDIHSGMEDGPVLAATAELAELVKPRYLFVHDLLDFRTRNHHDRGSLRKAFAKAAQGMRLVESEVENAASCLRMLSRLAREVRVVRSNHDEAFDRWLEEATDTIKMDPENAPYFFRVWARMFDHMQEHGEFPQAFELEAKRLGVPANVKFLKRDESCKIKGVEHAFHGDKGINGSRGTPHAYARLGVKTTTGHTHTPTIRDGNFTAGVTARLDQGYNLLPSTWLNAHVIQYANGKRALVVIIQGRFRAPVAQAKKTKRAA